MHRFDHLEELLFVEYSELVGVKIFVGLRRGERMSTAFVTGSIPLDYGMADAALCVLDVRTIRVMGQDFVIDSKKETGEIVDHNFLIKQWRSDEVGQLGDVSISILR